MMAACESCEISVSRGNILLFQAENVKWKNWDFVNVYVLFDLLLLVGEESFKNILRLDRIFLMSQ